ncbi:MAG TPA: nuclear transport factor 2 family protein [Ktedonobacterales bacterium]
MTHPNAALVERFYAAFARRDPDGMIACYDPNVTFSDPVFQTLKGERAGAMWRMLAGRSQDLKVAASDIQADDTQGSAHWVALYTYSATGRRVRNVVNARFRFQNGRIILHQDTFDLWKWAAQALGPSGQFLGWTLFMRSAIRRNAARALDAYIARRAGSPT